MTEIQNATEAMREQITRMMKIFNLPDVDLASLVENQRRNIDAMSKAAQLTNEAATQVSHRQLEIFKAASEQLADMFKEMKLSSQQRQEIATKAFDSAAARAKELAEMTAKSNREVFDLAKQRMTESFQELRKMFPENSWGR
jgi:phasin family protein